MSARLFLRTVAFATALAAAVCLTPATFARGGGGGGGHGGGGFGGGFGGGRGGGGFSAGRGFSGGGRSFSGYSNARSFAAPAYRGSSQVGRYGGNYAGGRNFANYGNRYGGYGDGHGYGRWNNYFNRGWGGYGLAWGGWGLGVWPWYTGWDWGWGYPYAYSLYGYYPSDDYYYDYGQDGYGQGNVVYGEPSTAVPTPAVADNQPVVNAENQQAASQAEEYYSQGREAFLAGDYQSALKFAAHAEIEAPSNPRVHELLSLSLFALKKYPAAASEAHAAMAMGPIPQWADLYGYYNDVNKYTDQLRALEQAVTDNPKAAADHFLLGYHYLMTGARSNAESEFAEAVQLTPKDKLAEHYLAELKANAPLTPPARMAEKPQNQTR